jgi:hypothetical protein
MWRCDRCCLWQRILLAGCGQRRRCRCLCLCLHARNLCKPVRVHSNFGCICHPNPRTLAARTGMTWPSRADEQKVARHKNLKRRPLGTQRTKGGAMADWCVSVLLVTPVVCVTGRRRCAHSHLVVLCSEACVKVRQGPWRGSKWDERGFLVPRARRTALGWAGREPAASTQTGYDALFFSDLSFVDNMCFANKTPNILKAREDCAALARVDSPPQQEARWPICTKFVAQTFRKVGCFCPQGASVANLLSDHVRGLLARPG